MMIETQRLRMRPYAPEDVDWLHRLWTAPAVRRYLLDDEIVARAFVENEVEQTRALFDEQGFGQCIIEWKHNDARIGFCGYRFFFEPPELQLIYGIDPAYWGQGFASEAARAMIRYGFETCGFDTILASADLPNTASFRVMENAGMGFYKQVLINGADTVYYMISRDDFEAGA